MFTFIFCFIDWAYISLFNLLSSFPLTTTATILSPPFALHSLFLTSLHLYAAFFAELSEEHTKRSTKLSFTFHIIM